MSHDVAPQNHHDPEESVDETTVPLMLLGGLCLVAFFTLSGDPGPPAGHHGHGMDRDVAAESGSAEDDVGDEAVDRGREEAEPEAATTEHDGMGEHEGDEEIAPEQTREVEDAAAPDDRARRDSVRHEGATHDAPLGRPVLRHRDDDADE